VKQESPAFKRGRLKELETLVQEQDRARAFKEAQEIAELLGVSLKDSIDRAYIDLLLEKQD